VRSATPRARAQHAAGNLDNRHVEILCAASACVNVSVFYQPLTAPTALGLLGVAPRRGFSRSGSAWLGRSQKDGLPTCCGDMRITVQGHQLAHRGSLVAAPSNRGGRKWTPRRATLLCSPSCPCYAQSSLGRGIEMFLARSFLRSAQSRLSAQPMGSGADSRHAKEKAPLSGRRRG